MVQYKNCQTMCKLAKILSPRISHSVVKSFVLLQTSTKGNAVSHLTARESIWVRNNTRSVSPETAVPCVPELMLTSYNFYVLKYFKILKGIGLNEFTIGMVNIRDGSLKLFTRS